MLNHIFRFPADDLFTLEQVKIVLDLVDLPAGVIDRRFRTLALNAAAHTYLAKLGIVIGDRSKGSRYYAVRTPLRPYVMQALNTGRAVFLPETAGQRLIEDLPGVVVCPGRVQDSDLAFVIAIPGFKGTDGQGALERILESFKLGAVLMGPDLRHRYMNSSALEAFGLKRGDTIGKMTSEVNPSPQAKVHESQMRHAIDTRRGSIEEAFPLASAKFGLIRCRLIAWPIWSAEGSPEGIIMLIGALARSDEAAEPDRQTLEMLGRDAHFHGPPVFYTHVDGTVALMTAGAKPLLVPEAAGRLANFKTDIRWTHPEVIAALYANLLGGAETATAMTDIETPAGARTMHVLARGIRDVGNIVSQACFVLSDSTEQESARRMLAETVRNLAGEKEVLDRIVEALDMQIAVVDENLTVVRINPAVARRLGISPDDAVGKPMDQVVPTARQTGMAGLLKSALEKDSEVHIERFEHITKDGRMVPLEATLYPLRLGGRKYLMAVSREMLEEEALERRAVRWERVYRAVVANIREGVFVLNKDGRIDDLNDVVAEPRGGRDKVIGTPGDEHLMPIRERDQILEAQRRAIETGEVQRSGLMKVTRTATGQEHFVEITHVPVTDPQGRKDGVISVIYFATGVVDLAREVREYIVRLEKVLREKTAEVTAAKRLLTDAVGKVSDAARSGSLMASLEDEESVYRAFLGQARAAVGADFVTLVVADKERQQRHRAYYSDGTPPAPDAIDSAMIERAIARPAPSGGGSEMVWIVKPDTLVADIDLGRSRGLLLAWRGRGEFTQMDIGVTGVLCAQFATALPVSKYVHDLRGGRDRADCLRRIAVEVAGASSVEEAVRRVAAEVGGVLPADRMMWIVEGSPGELWVRQVFNRSGDASSRVVRIPFPERARAAHAKGLESVRGKSFCDILPGGKPGGAGIGDTPAGACPFAARTGPGQLQVRMRELLSEAGYGCEGKLLPAVAPVALTESSYGLLCAWPSAGRKFTPDDTCFTCVAASMIGSVWRAADAAAAVRRLEAVGDSVGEIVHDLKYPLSRVREGLARLDGVDGAGGGVGVAGGAGVADGGGAAAPTGEVLAGLRTELGHVASLVDELAEVSNPRRRNPEVIELEQAVDHCLGLLAGDIGGKGIRVTKRMGDAPPVFADRRDFTRVLLNLLANGVEAVAANGEITISARAERGGAGPGTVRLVFEDSGPGIPADSIHKVFDPFYTTKQGGTGLGLFSARKRAQASGGSLTCELGEDGKSRFVASFPAAMS